MLESKFKITEYYFTNLNYNVDVNLYDLEATMKSILSASELKELLEKAMQFRYPYILWKDYRCNLIHETRKPLEVNIKSHEIPFYVNLTVLDKSYEVSEPERTKFRIPTLFIFETLSNCIKNFKEECIKNSADPFIKNR